MPRSDAQIRNLRPREQPYKVGDFDEHDIPVTPTGSRLWRMQYRIAGREKRLAFRAHAAASLARARQFTGETRPAFAAGGALGEVKQERKRLERTQRGITFTSQAAAFIDKARRQGKAQATMDKSEWLLGMANEAFGSRPITEVTATCRWHPRR